MVYFYFIGSRKIFSVLAEGSGGGDFTEERGNPGPSGLSEGSSAGERGSEAEPGSAGDPEAERAERKGEGAEQEGVMRGASIFTPTDALS